MRLDRPTRWVPGPKAFACGFSAALNAHTSGYASRGNRSAIATPICAVAAATISACRMSGRRRNRSIGCPVLRRTGVGHGHPGKLPDDIPRKRTEQHGDAALGFEYRRVQRGSGGVRDSNSRRASRTSPWLVNPDQTAKPSTLHDFPRVRCFP